MSQITFTLYLHFQLGFMRPEYIWTQINLQCADAKSYTKRCEIINSLYNN